MDWMQTFTFVATMAASTFGFYLIIRDDIKKMDDRHREDIKNMDSKWERLFERFLIERERKL